MNATQAQTEAPQIISIVNSNNIVTVTWSSVSGSVYRLEYASDLGNKSVVERSA